MKIYLAGKMDELGNWRDGLLLPKPWKGPSLWHSVGNEDKIWDDDGAGAINWPLSANQLVLGQHEYVGPYRSELPHANVKWVGTLHGNDARGQHGMMDYTDEKCLTRLCLTRIDMADLVFAYLNSFDVFGTLVELGYASARGKFIVAVEHDNACGDESLWFAGSVAHLSERYHSTEWTDDGERCFGSEHEHAFLRAALLDGISRYTAWRESHTRRPDIRAVVSQSFQQIIQWTSDPRVRSEARKMVRMLETSR